MKNKWFNAVITIGMAGLMLSTLFYGCSSMELKNELRTQSTLLERTQAELTSTVKKLHEESIKSDQLSVELDYATKSLSLANETISALKATEYELVYIGEFKLTHYCTETYKHICGMGAGITATGTKVTAGRTVAVDPKVIPYGTQIYIEGYGWRTAEDCGGAVKDKQIDIAVNTHDEALSMGVANSGVWLLVKTVQN